MLASSSDSCCRWVVIKSYTIDSSITTSSVLSCNFLYVGNFMTNIFNFNLTHFFTPRFNTVIPSSVEIKAIVIIHLKHILSAQDSFSRLFPGFNISLVRFSLSDTQPIHGAGESGASCFPSGNRMAFHRLKRNFSSAGLPLQLNLFFDRLILVPGHIPVYVG